VSSPPTSAGGARSSAPAQREWADSLQLALRSEQGAGALYPWLARRAREPELADVLRELAKDATQQIAELRRLLADLAIDAPLRGRRRQLASLAIAALTLVFGLRFALRLSLDAEETVARWYDSFAHRFHGTGEFERARLCDGWAQRKRRHADVLRAFLAHSQQAGGEF
jgi:rubrerythrin